MSPRFLRVAALAVVVITATALAVFLVISVPRVDGPSEWTRDDVIARGRAIVDSGAARLLDPKGHAEAVRLIARVESGPASASSNDIDASPDYAGMRIQDHASAARFARTLAIITLAIALFAALLALVRAFRAAPGKRRSRSGSRTARPCAGARTSPAASSSAR